MKKNLPIGVIGGGLGGLAAACTLAARGHRVTLFERNDWLGGKAAILEGNGFRFDMGPTIVTIPSVLRRIFTEAGRRMEDYLELVRLDPQWRCFFEDQSVLDLVQNPEQMAGRLDQFAPGRNSGQKDWLYGAVWLGVLGWSLQGLDAVTDNSELTKRVFSLIDTAMQLGKAAATAAFGRSARDNLHTGSAGGGSFGLADQRPICSLSGGIGGSYAMPVTDRHPGNHYQFNILGGAARHYY